MMRVISSSLVSSLLVIGSLPGVSSPSVSRSASTWGDRVLAQAASGNTLPTYQPDAPPRPTTPLPDERQQQEAQPIPADRRVSALQVDRDGHLWVASWQGLAKIDSETGQIYIRVPLPNTTISALAQDRQGRIWAGTSEGLVRLDPRGHITGQNFALPSNRVLALLVDRRGYLWVGTDGGLVLINPNQGQIMTTFKTLPGVSANALSLDAKGNLWVGTLEGIVQINTASALVMRQITGLPGATVQVLATRYQTVTVPNPKAIRQQIASQPPIRPRPGRIRKPAIPAKPAKPVKPEPAFINILTSTLWVGTPNALLELDTDTGQILQVVTPMQGRNITSLRFDRTDRLWVGTSTGLMRVQPANGTIDGEIAKHLPSRRIMSLSPDTGGKLWVGTSEGLAWVSMQTFKTGTHQTFRRE